MVNCIDTSRVERCAPILDSGMHDASCMVFNVDVWVNVIKNVIEIQSEEWITSWMHHYVRIDARLEGLLQLSSNMQQLIGKKEM